MNYAYITLLTRDSYLPGVLILKESLRSVGSKYPLVCMITEGLSDNTLTVLEKAHIKTILVDNVSLPERIYEHNKAIDAETALVWRDCLTKIQMFSFTEYDKLIFCDADLLILKNVDHCFELPHMTAALDGEIYNLWPNWDHFNTGFVVIRPDASLRDSIIEFTNSLNPDEIYDSYGRHYVLADQEILNLYYKNWPNEPEKHLSKYYNVFVPHTPKERNEEVLNNAYFVHYVGQKPWLFPIPYRDITGYKSLFFYCIALSLYDIILENDYQDIDWANMADRWPEKTFITSVDKLYDVDTMNYFLKFISNNPNYNKYVNIAHNNNLCEKVAPLLYPVIDVFRTTSNQSDLISLMAYSILDNRQYSANRAAIINLWNNVSASIGKTVGDKFYEEK